MALLWSKKTPYANYQVRCAGNSVRLYTDGVFHSQYNPKNPITGSVWDLLFIPAFFHDNGRIKRVLVLGVGGGAVIRQILHFLRPEHIVGVELSAVHLMLAKRYFGLRDKKVALIKADASQWLATYKGPKFDFIVDDIFTEHDGAPVKAVPADANWFKLLLKHLSDDGVLVSNFISDKEMQTCAYFEHTAIRRRFASAFRLTTPITENAVAVFLRKSAGSAQLRLNLKNHPILQRALKTKKLRYTIRRINCE
jgi:spermidine synthase